MFDGHSSGLLPLCAFSATQPSHLRKTISHVADLTFSYTKDAVFPAASAPTDQDSVVTVVHVALKFCNGFMYTQMGWGDLPSCCVGGDGGISTCDASDVIAAIQAAVFVSRVQDVRKTLADFVASPCHQDGIVTDETAYANNVFIGQMFGVADCEKDLTVTKNLEKCYAKAMQVSSRSARAPGLRARCSRANR